MAYCGWITSSVSLKVNGKFSRHAAIFTYQSGKAVKPFATRGLPAFSSSPFSFASAYFTSLRMGSFTTLFLLISELSMSMWTIVPCFANSLILPVTRSSKRTPMASSRSASFTALLAYTVPCMPSHLSESSCVSGKQPMPISVVATGMPVRSTNSSNSALASPEMMPPPQ